MTQQNSEQPESFHLGSSIGTAESRAAKHTPGPWHCALTTVFALHGHEPRNRFSAIVQAGRREDADWPELLANARLMAASPELYEVVGKLLEAHKVAGDVVTFSECVDEFIEEARHAFAKATSA
jgi:hypothetical protein